MTRALPVSARIRRASSTAASGLSQGDSMHSAQERMDRLEAQAYFQEQALAELNSALVLQQSQIDGLERRLAAAEKRLAALSLLLEEGGRDAPPPHYGRI
jgi:uncharacterized coiled-coil protein SlyX